MSVLLDFGDFLEAPDLALGFTLFAEELWADIWSVPAEMVCFVWLQARADFVGAAAFGARPSSAGKARGTLHGVGVGGDTAGLRQFVGR